MVSIIVAPASRNSVADDVPVLSESVRRYTCRTFKQDFSPHKLEARSRLRDVVLANEAFAPRDDGRIIHALTLPGPWWHFESGLSNQKHFYWTGVEGEESLFRLAALRMPGGATSEDAKRFYSQYRHKRLHCPVVRGLRHKLLRCDVHAYLRHTEHEFGLIWLDLCAPISRRILYSVVSASERLRGDGATFALTVQAARETITMLMEMGGVQNRLDFIGDVGRSLLGRDWHEVSRFRYSDGAPMVQFIFQRKETARKARTSRSVARLADSIRESFADLPPYVGQQVRFE